MFLNSATATFGLVRTLSGSIGITIGGTIFGSELRRRLPLVQGIDATQFAGASGEAALAHVTALKNIQPPEVRQAVLRAYGDSLRVVWIVATPIAAFGLACSLIIKVYSLTNKQSTKHDPEKNAQSQEDSAGVSDSQATLENDQNAAERSAQSDPAATTIVPEIIEEEPFDPETIDEASHRRRT